ncbi:MAG: response regulator [Planctomycetia bacterium]|nr:response regulator [Planctomycetia bacterium]
MRNGLSIIVVDDQPAVAESTALVLREDGHQVQVFNSGKETLAALDRISPDLVLSDLGMPEMDGCELAVRIRQRLDCESLLLAAITGFQDDEHLKAAIDAGFDFWFVKPMSPADLKEFIAQLERRSR